MELTKHRDGTVSVRMTTSQLVGLRNSAHTEYAKWLDITLNGDGDGRKMIVDRDIRDNALKLYTELDAFVLTRIPQDVA